MFVTMTITPQELKRLARPEHVDELRGLLRSMDDRRHGILPPDYRVEWIKELEGLINRGPSEDGLAPTPRMILRKLKEAGPVFFDTDRWGNALDIQDPQEWWSEIEAGHLVHAHDVIVGSDASPCPRSLQGAKAVWEARNAQVELLRPMPSVSVQGLSELVKLILPPIRIHELVVFESRHIQPNHRREFPYVLEVILDSLTNPASHVDYIGIYTQCPNDGGCMRYRLIRRIKSELHGQKHEGTLRPISIEFRSFPDGDLPANRRIFLGNREGPQASEAINRFNFQRGLVIDHPEGSDSSSQEGDPTTVGWLDEAAIAGGSSRQGRSSEELKKERVELFELITTDDLLEQDC